MITRHITFCPPQKYPLFFVDGSRFVSIETISTAQDTHTHQIKSAHMTTFPSSKVIVAPSKADVPESLCNLVAVLAIKALKDHNAVSIALSGGSLPSFLGALPDAFKDTDPQWSKWHVFLADERCVPEDHADSNMKALKEKFLSKTEIPADQIYAINLLDTTEAVANEYETRLMDSLEKFTHARLDIAVLGFGPDGHTCSLFPGHELVAKDSAPSTWVASIEDSPKPPPKRITLTLMALNQYTDNIIVCGAGSSKQPIVAKVFQSITQLDDGIYQATMTSPPPYPCSMVTPKDTLTWVLDKDALGDEDKIGSKL